VLLRCEPRGAGGGTRHPLDVSPRTNTAWLGINYGWGLRVKFQGLGFKIYILTV
jgi:hypothetical protein